MTLSISNGPRVAQPELAPTLSFSVDTDHLIKSTARFLVQHESVANWRKDWAELSAKLAELSPLAEKCFFEYRKPEHVPLEEWKAAEEQSAQWLLDFYRSEAFTGLHALALQSQVEAESEWGEKLKDSTKIITDLTGLSFSGDRINVIITDPDIREGRLAPQQKRIYWRHSVNAPAPFKNYTTVYLWHELLHTKLGGNDTPHAVIELIADNQLRVALNGGTYGPAVFEGHTALLPRKQQLYPDWREYLSGPTHDIRAFIAAAIQKYGGDSVDEKAWKAVGGQRQE
jgi:hypothetical protein